MPELPEGTVAEANIIISSNFTLIGTTKTITFPARVDYTGNNLAVEATFKLDRTQWGMTYTADPALKNFHIFPEVAIYL